MRPKFDLILLLIITLFGSAAFGGGVEEEDLDEEVEWDTTAKNNEPRTYNGTGVCARRCC